MKAPILATAAVATTLSLVGGPAMAQPTFTPPLASAAPLSEPVYIELQPGARSDCIVTMTADAPEIPPMPATTASTVVADAPGGLRVTVSEDLAGTEIVVFLGDDGEVVFESMELDDTGLTPAQRDAIVGGVEEMLPAALLHRRTLAQDEVVLNAEELSGALGGLLEGMPPGVSMDMTGGSVVAGEVTADGAPTLVLDTDFVIDLTMSGQGQTITIVLTAAGHDAIDIETGLYRASRYDMVMQMPPEMQLPNSQLNMQMDMTCEIIAGGS